MPKGKNNSVLKVSPYKFFLASDFLLTSFFALAIYILVPKFFLLYNFAVARNISTFILCGFDKSVSSTTAMRVPEYVLYISAFLGGSLGLMLATQIFRHKIRKSHFKFWLLLIITVQIALFRLYKENYLYY